MTDATTHVSDGLDDLLAAAKAYAVWPEGSKVLGGGVWRPGAPQPQTRDASDALAFMRAHDEFRRLATAQAIVDLIDLTRAAVAALAPVARAMDLRDHDLADEHLDADPDDMDRPVNFTTGQARAIRALIASRLAMTAAAGDIRNLLAATEPETVDGLRGIVKRGIEAFRLTREYVGEDVLPAEPGWSWFDWTTEARAAVEDK